MTGIRNTRGSLRYKDSVSDFDAPIIERFHEAGAVILGKTNLPEFGWKGDSTNRIIGSTHNPWKYGRTAGGSSGGGTAAVAAGLGPACSRQRWCRFDSYSGEFLRYLRTQTLVGTHPTVSR